MNSVPFLHSWLTLDEAAVWLQITKRKLAAMSRYKGSRIPALWLNQKTGRFNPALILSKMAAERNIDPEMVRALLDLEKD